MNLRKNWREKGELHTSALNDILFILLFFFLIISTLANPNLVKVSIPKARSDSKDKQSIVVTVDSLKQFYIGTTRIVPDSLGALLQQAASQSSEREFTVVVNGDVQAQWGGVFHVIREAKKQGLKTVVAVDKE